jgi:hypothetical protein
MQDYIVETKVSTLIASIDYRPSTLVCPLAFSDPQAKRSSILYHPFSLNLSALSPSSLPAFLLIFNPV